MNRRFQGLVVVHFLLVCFVSGSAQTSAQAPLVNDLRELVETPAVPGYEQQLAAKIAEKLKGLTLKIDA
ncbi:MAG TPA: hypothetical protein VIX19_19300, partial [Terriglobales bacterium]